MINQRGNEVRWAETWGLDYKEHWHLKAWAKEKEALKETLGQKGQWLEGCGSKSDCWSWALRTLLAVWSWENHLDVLNLSFLIYKMMEIIMLFH